MKLGRLFPLPLPVDILRRDEPYPLVCKDKTKEQIHGHVPCVNDKFDPARTQMVLSFRVCSFHPHMCRILLSERSKYYFR